MSVPNDTLINTESTTGNGELTSEAAISATYKVKPEHHLTQHLYLNKMVSSKLFQTMLMHQQQKSTDKVKISYVEKLVIVQNNLEN